ncbi:MAG: hypothetical protein RJA83_1165 [Pseudomonadota bacterium]|jgi:hypothetical protein
MKANMLTILLQDIGQRLAKQPFSWMSWWWGLRWRAFISIHPPLTEKTPLWSRDDSSLKSIKLFKLTPNELQAEITRYWEKPFWHRWLLRLFTSIGSKIRIWSYYQHCLSFREVRKQYPFVEQRIMIYEPEQKLITALVTALSRDNLALEQRLEKYSGNQPWIQKNFSALLTQHEKKRHDSFLELMKKNLKKLPLCNQGLVKRKLEKEYLELKKMLRAYLQGWCRDTLQQDSKTSESDNALVYVGPAIVAEKTVSSSSESDLCCSSSINLWVNRRRQTIDAILQEQLSEEEQANKVKIVLEESLNSLSLLIDPQIEGYQRVVKEAIQGKVNYQEVIKWSESLQSGLLKVYRNGARLFHPDKLNGSPGLQMLLTQLFQQFKRSSESALEKIHQGQDSLKEWFGHSLEWELRIRKLFEELVEDRARHNEYMKQKFKELDESIKEIREQMHALDIKLKNNKEALNAVEEGLRINKEMAKNNAEQLRLVKEQFSAFIKTADANSENQAQEQEENEKATTSFSPRP